MRFLQSLEKQQGTWILILSSIVFFFLRFPSFFEPLWDADSSIYSVIGLSLHQGRLLYSTIWDNKTPLLYYIYALFSGDQTAVRIFSFFIGLLSIYFFYVLSLHFVHKRTAFWITGLFTIFLGTPLFAANTANAENFMVPLLLCAVALFLQPLRTFPQDVVPKRLVYVGALLGLAAMLKVVAVFDLAAVVFTLLSFSNIRSRRDMQKIGRRFWPLVGGFIAPFFLFALYFLIRQTLPQFLYSIFIANIPYVGFANNLFIPYGFLFVRLLLLVAGLVFLFKRRADISRKTYFILSWVLFGLFEAFFPARSFSHYALLLVPSMLLLGGTIWQNFFYIKRNVVWGFVGFSCLISLFFLQPTWLLASYYPNFISFIIGQKTAEGYQAAFDPNTPTDYAVAAFLNTQLHPHDQVVVWGDKPQLYLLINRIPVGALTVVYHTAFLPHAVSEEGKAFAQAAPRFVIIYPGQIAIPYSLATYTNVFAIRGVTVYEKNNSHITK